MNYYFINDNYFNFYRISPLGYLMINEEFESVRRAFGSLEDDVKNILHYLIISDDVKIDIDIDDYLDDLRNRYLYYYNNCDIRDGFDKYLNN